MNHPDISTYNANLYLVKMMHDADEYRLAQKFEQKPRENLWWTFAKKLLTLSTKSIRKTVTPTA